VSLLENPHKTWVFIGPEPLKKNEGNLGLKNMQEENVTQFFFSQTVVSFMVMNTMVFINP